MSKSLPTGEVIRTWSPDQVARFKQLQSDPTVWLGYWFSDKKGQPPFGNPLQVSAGPGVVHEADQAVLCCTGLHATRHLLFWGAYDRRCWIVALSGDRQVGDDKACATRREILGEVLPEDRGENWRLRIASGEKDFSGMDLTGANLNKAKLAYRNLQGANLAGVPLRKANLYRAYLAWANLSGADLRGADLSGADLSGTDLSWANLQGASLIGANLRKADLSGADLTVANLRGARLTGANLRGANLHGANLSRAYLGGVDLTGAYGVESVTGFDSCALL